ncbi:hypothetical protein WAF17_12215 [Bernardetia sp. ABR2-2B]|uniref:hypothetical protein n=1 Tax=Bernardetia sp. ABR2-2B TaxID=3127472 RepID=UPI0030D3999E
MKKISVIVLFLGMILSAFAVKNYSKKEIDEITNAIDHYSAFSLQTLNANEVYETTFDGGGEIKILWRGDEAKKVHQDIFLSYGKLSTTFYFDNKKIIKIIETEENFEFKEDMSLNYDKLTEVFKEEIYVLDYENEIVEKQIIGERKVSNDVSVTKYYQTADFILEKIKN